VKLSPHTARALKNAPLKNKDAAWFKSKPDLRDTDLRADSHSEGRIQRSAGSCTNGSAVVICFASFIGSTNAFAFEHQREVCSVSDEVMLSQSGDATPIRPITGRHSLPLISDTRIIIVRLTAFYLLRGTIRAYPVPMD
jgi:hypothetical protein